MTDKQTPTARNAQKEIAFIELYGATNRATFVKKEDAFIDVSFSEIEARVLAGLDPFNKKSGRTK